MKKNKVIFKDDEKIQNIFWARTYPSMVVSSAPAEELLELLEPLVENPEYVTALILGERERIIKRLSH